MIRGKSQSRFAVALLQLMVLFALSGCLRKTESGSGFNPKGRQASTDFSPALPSLTYSLQKVQALIQSPINDVIPENKGGPISDCEIAPEPPQGLDLSKTCILTGTPSKITAKQTYVITASNTTGKSSFHLDIEVTDYPPSVSFQNPVITLTTEKATAIHPTVSGGAITECLITPKLPQGLAYINGWDCEIVGKPESTSPPRRYTLTARNSGGSSSATFNLEVKASGSSASPTLPSPPTEASQKSLVSLGGKTLSFYVYTAHNRELLVHDSSSGKVENLGGVLVGVPQALVLGGSVVVIARGQDSRVWYLRLSDRQWKPISGVTFQAFAQAPFIENGSIVIRVVGSDQKIYRATVSTSSASSFVAEVISSPTIPANPTTPTNPTSPNLPLPPVDASQKSTVSWGGGTLSFYVHSAGKRELLMHDSVSGKVENLGQELLGVPQAIVLGNSVVVVAIAQWAQVWYLRLADKKWNYLLWWSPAFAGAIVRSFAKPLTLENGAAIVRVTTDIAGKTYRASISANSASTLAPEESPPAVDPAPASLAYPGTTDSQAQALIFVKESAITALTPTVSGKVTKYTILPSLPQGMSVHPTTGVISGTSSEVSPAKRYQVTAENSSGSISAYFWMKVKDVPPRELSYLSFVTPPTFTQEAAIAASYPTSKGGAIRSYRVSPSFPRGISLDPVTGVISGTPLELAAEKDYLITGSTEDDSTSATIRFRVIEKTPEAPQLPLPPLSESEKSVVPISRGALSFYVWTAHQRELLMHNSFTGVVENLGGILSSVPRAINLGNDTVIVVKGSDSRVWFLRLSNRAWTQMSPIPIQDFSQTLRIESGSVLIRVIGSNDQRSYRGLINANSHTALVVEEKVPPADTSIVGFEKIPLGTVNQISALVIGPNEVLALGDAGTIRKISKGSNGTLTISNETLPNNSQSNLYSGAYGNGEYYIGGGHFASGPYRASFFRKVGTQPWQDISSTITTPERGPVAAISFTGRYFSACQSATGRCVYRDSRSESWNLYFNLSFGIINNQLPLSEHGLLTFGRVGSIYSTDFSKLPLCRVAWGPNECTQFLGDTFVGRSVDLRGAASDGRNIVAVGAQTHGTFPLNDKNGAIGSADLTQPWTTISIPTNGKKLTSVTYTGAEYVAVGEAGIIFTSVDGKTWSKRASPTSQNLFSVAFVKEGTLSGSLLIAGGGGELYRLPLSNGLVSLPVVPAHLGYEEVSLNPFNLPSLADIPPTKQTINALVAGPNEVLALGDTGIVRRIAKAKDTEGFSITSETLPFDVQANLYSGTYGKDRYLIGGSGITNQRQHILLTRSMTGSWENITDSLNANTPGAKLYQIESIAYTGRFFAVAAHAGRVWTSQENSVFDPWMNSLALGVSIFGDISVVSETKLLAFTGAGSLFGLQYLGSGSSCGKPWCRTAIVNNNYTGVPLDFKSVAKRAETIVAVGSGSPIGVIAAISTNEGATWAPVSIPTEGKVLNSITHTGSEFVAVGEGGIIFSSRDGKTWTKEPSPTLQDIKSVIYVKEGAFSGYLFFSGKNGMVFRRKVQ